MKKIGKIGVFLFLIFVLTGISLLVQEILGMRITRLTMVGALITCYGSYFFTYSKWANNNIWNKKTSKPTNESIDPTNPNDDNQKVLDNIQNVLNFSDDNSALQKIEELKRQIEILEQAIKNNDSNSEIESPELSEEELKELKESEQIEKESFMKVVVVSIIVVVILAAFIFAIGSGDI